MVYSWVSRKSGCAEEILRELARQFVTQNRKSGGQSMAPGVRIKNGVVVGGAGGKLNGLQWIVRMMPQRRASRTKSPSSAWVSK